MALCPQDCSGPLHSHHRSPQLSLLMLAYMDPEQFLSSFALIFALPNKTVITDQWETGRDWGPGR